MIRINYKDFIFFCIPSFRKFASTFREACGGLFLSFLFLFCASQIDANVKLPAVLSDNMVLQQRATINIWGWADPNESVTIQPSWTKKAYDATTNSNGQWLVKIETPKASSKSYELRIRGKNEIIIKNVLIGEVWFASGQSNMDFPVSKRKGWRSGVIDYEEQMKDADYPEIRLFRVEQTTSLAELDDCSGKWEVCNPDNLMDFSAVAFFFGRSLYKNLKRPLGLIHSAWGGTPVEAWTKFSVIENDAVYSDLLKNYRKTKEEFPSEMAKYEEEKARYDAEKERGNTEIKAPKKPQGVNHSKSLATLWNAMVHPLAPFVVKGVIWYQGESNAHIADLYTHMFSNMISSWRTEFRNDNMPFYFVQIAPYYQQPPEIREAQLKTWQTVENTGMAVVTDVGDSLDIHPRNKLIPGERLARWALAKTYGKKIAFSGPLYKSISVADFGGGKAVLTFDYVEKGLKFSGDKLTGFTIAGDDGRFYPANAEIVGKTVIVSSPRVPKPVAVRYGWDNYFRANLCNSSGLPASPFRTDNN